jgi:hypothetical protein
VETVVPVVRAAQAVQVVRVVRVPYSVLPVAVGGKVEPAGPEVMAVPVEVDPRLALS